MSQRAPRILVAGIGNIFLGDDAFGVEVVQRLAAQARPENVHVEDFGIRGLDLTYRLLDDYDVAILVDAAARGKPPGTVFLIEPEPGEIAAPASGAVMIDTHNIDPVKVLALAAAMGGRVRRVLVVGCEPQRLAADDDDMQMGLSPPVQAAVEEAVKLIESLLAELAGAASSPRGSYA